VEVYERIGWELSSLAVVVKERVGVGQPGNVKRREQVGVEQSWNSMRG
jgi:hypothetical protein